MVEYHLADDDIVGKGNVYNEKIGLDCMGWEGDVIDMEDLTGVVRLLGQGEAALGNVAVDHVYHLEGLWVGDGLCVEVRNEVIGESSSLEVGSNKYALESAKKAAPRSGDVTGNDFIQLTNTSRGKKPKLSGEFIVLDTLYECGHEDLSW
ncbi:hypothetical protein ACLOJK_017363 [Asimina triloba]